MRKKRGCSKCAKRRKEFLALKEAREKEGKEKAAKEKAA